MDASSVIEPVRAATLGPSEALFLATAGRPGAHPEDLVRAAFADAVLRDVLRLWVVRVPTFLRGDRLKAMVTRGEADPDVLTGPERAVADAVLPMVSEDVIATLQAVALGLHHAFGESLTRYRDEWVEPALVERGLMEERQDRFLLLLKVRHVVLTEVGRAAADRLSVALAAASSAPESFASEALARELGTGAFVVPALREHAPHLSCMMSGRQETECRGSGPLTADAVACIDTWIRRGVGWE